MEKSGHAISTDNYEWHLHCLLSQQQQMRANVSGVSFPNELRDLLQRRLGDLESQLLKKVNELEEEKSQLYNETAAHRQSTENTLSVLMNRIKELEKGSHGAAARHSAL